MFEQEYARFMGAHLAHSSGERLRRLQEGHGHAERTFLQQVWWPAVNSFDGLHPEYEVHDFKDGVRYLDYAYLRFPVKIAFEIDGYGPHFSNVSRWQFGDNLMRQNHLVLDGWRVLRFSYDDIAEKPRRCQQLIQQCMGVWFHKAASPPVLSLSAKEQQLVKLLVRRQAPLTPAETAEHLGVSGRHARTLLQRRVRERVLVPASGCSRIRKYKLNPGGTPWS
jgi:hypothetical protein